MQKQVSAFRRQNILRFFFCILPFLIQACEKSAEKPNVHLNAVVTGNVKGLDPALSNDTYMHKVIGHIYETLLTYDYFSEKPTLIPLLAESLPHISKDGLTYTFKIKKGIRFQNDDAFPDKKGRELIADDFIYSWKRIADASTLSESFWLFDGRIVGLNEWRNRLTRGSGKFGDAVAGLSAPDSATLVIKLIRPDYQLSYALATVQTSVVAHETVEKYAKEFMNHPVGTGPYLLKEWVHNNKIIVSQNPNYRNEYFPKGIAGMEIDAGKKLPFSDQITFYEMIEDQTRWLNFMKGNLDISGIPKDDFDSAVDRKTKLVKGELQSRGVRISRTPRLNIVFRIFNMADPFLGKNKKVRQAIALADDREMYIDKFYNGRGSIATLPFPPGIDGFDPNFKNPYAIYDVDQAKKLLKEAGFEEGKGIPEFTYEIMNSTTGRQEGELFQRNMSEIGIKIKVHVNSWPELNEKIKLRKAQITPIAWVADYSDAENFYQLLYGKNVSPGSNSSNYDNPVFNALYEKASRLPPGAERNAIYIQMAQIVAEDCPWSLTAYRDDFYLSQPWTRNYRPMDWASAPLQYVGVDGEKRVVDRSKF